MIAHILAAAVADLDRYIAPGHIAPFFQAGAAAAEVHKLRADMARVAALFELSVDSYTDPATLRQKQCVHETDPVDLAALMNAETETKTAVARIAMAELAAIQAKPRRRRKTPGHT